jgi:hypothetical protein
MKAGQGKLGVDSRVGVDLGVDLDVWPIALNFISIQIIKFVDGLILGVDLALHPIMNDVRCPIDITHGCFNFDERRSAEPL